MAETDSAANAQAPQKCQMCEETTAVKFKCLECKFLLCQRCRGFHEKVKTQLIHQIVDLSGLGPVCQEVACIKQTPCKVHETENYILYCEDCSEPICTTCVATMHQKHMMLDLKAVCSEKINAIKKLGAKIDQIILPNLARKQKRLKDMLYFHSQKAEKAKHRIQTWQTYLKDNIVKVLDTQRDELFKSLDKNLTEVEESISQEMLKLEHIEKEAVDVITSISQVSEAIDFDKIRDLENTVELKISEITNHKILVRTKFPVFDQKQMSSVPMLGKINFKNVFHVKLVSSSETGLTCVDKIAVGDDDALILRNSETHTLNKVGIGTDGLVNRAKWKIDVKDMDFLKPDRLVVILPDKTVVSTFSLQDKADTGENINMPDTHLLFDSKPQIPTAIHVSRENNIIISTVEPERDAIPMDEPCNVTIFIITENGEVLSRYEFDKDLFCFPNKITSVDGDICIADSISDYSGRIVTLDKFGKVKWIYGDENSSLVISDLIPTPLSNIVLLEVCQETLHVLDSNGQRLYMWSLRDVGISHSFSLAINNDDCLLVGCGIRGQNLHVLEFIES